MSESKKKASVSRPAPRATLELTSKRKFLREAKTPTLKPQCRRCRQLEARLLTLMDQVRRRIAHGLPQQ